MLTQNQIATLEPRVRTIQIIVGALIMGVIGFAGIISVITDWNAVHSDFSILTILGVAVGLMMCLASMIVPSMIGQSAGQTAIGAVKSRGNKLDSEDGLNALVSTYQTMTVVRNAMLESAAFLNVLLFMIDHSLVSLAVMAGVIVLMLVTFPRATSIYGWIEITMRDGGAM